MDDTRSRLERGGRPTAVLTLTAPAHVEMGRRFSLRVVAEAEQELAAIDVTFESDTVRLDAGGRRRAYVTCTLRPARSGFRPLRVVAIGRDGAERGTATQVVAVSEEHTLPGATRVDEFLGREADRRYVGLYGSARSKSRPYRLPDDIASRRWGGQELEVAQVPWWLE